MNRCGIFFWKDGRTYKGYYKEDKKSDFGIYLKPEGKRYEGYWVNGCQSNLGRYIKKDGTIKLGIWSKNNLIEQYTSDSEFYQMKYQEIEDGIESTSRKVNDVIAQMKHIFSIYLPNTKLEEFIE